MKLVVGLGNPGSEYANTRHNAGWMVLDRVLAKHARGVPPREKFGSQLWDIALGPERVLLLRPLGFMNRSGSCVSQCASFYKIDTTRDLLVLVDEYAIALGQVRLREAGSPGGHNGLDDIQRALGSEQYPRLRIGIDPKPPEYDDLANWVLGQFTPEQRTLLEPALDKGLSAVEIFCRDGLTRAMNVVNAPPPRPKPPRPAPPPVPSEKPAEQPRMDADGRG